jgi:hypothetical protein
LAEVPHPVFYRDAGTLLFWHHSDAAEAHRFAALLRARNAEAKLQRVDAAGLHELEECPLRSGDRIDIVHPTVGG